MTGRLRNKALLLKALVDQQRRSASRISMSYFNVAERLLGEILDIANAHDQTHPVNPRVSVLRD